MSHRSISARAHLFAEKRQGSVEENAQDRATRLSGATKIVAGLWIALFVGGLILATSPPGLAAPARFELLGKHPDAALQPTTDGRTIATLKAYRGRIYAGYGDANMNTGPIAIRPFDPSSNSFSAPLLSADTEAIALYREINGSLYAPATDSKTGQDYALSNAGSALAPLETWRNEGGLGSSHVMDTFSLTGSDLWMIGSIGWNAVAWRSLDGGNTWAEVLNSPPIYGSGWAARYHLGFTYQGKAYLQATEHGRPHPTSYVFDGTEWTQGPDLFVDHYIDFGHHPEPFAGKIVFQTFPGEIAELLAFDGIRSEQVFNGQIRDFTVANDKVYVLTMEGDIAASGNLSTWTHVARAPRLTSSITVLGNEMYVGTQRAALYKLTLGSTQTRTSRQTS